MSAPFPYPYSPKQCRKDKRICRFSLPKKEATNLDLAFLIDVTNSMGHQLDNTRNSIEKIVIASKEKYDNNVRVGFVAYRDHESPLFVVQPFSSDSQNVISEMKKLTIDPSVPNSDIPEDVHGALMVSMALHFLKHLANISYSY